jgi:hypothetical protein
MSEAGEVAFPTARNLRVDELIKLYDGIIEQVDRSLAESAISSQIPLPEMPHGIDGVVKYGPHSDPLVPEDLTDLDSISLGKLFSFISNWTNYVQSELTRAKCVLIIQERHRKVVEAALTAFYRDEEGIPSSQVDERITTDRRYVDLDATVLRTKVFVLTAESRYEQLKRSSMLISREQTRRGEDFERMQHENASPKPWARIGRPTRAPK